MGKFSNLPIEILLEILTRLPTETVLECKLVCRLWRNLVHDPSFSRMHLTHLGNHHGELTFLCEESRNFNLNYLEYNENNQEHKIKRINMSPLIESNCKTSLIGSSNGLICLGVCHDSSLLYDYEPTYICNPITKEYVILPDVNGINNFKGCKYNGFGYLRETNEYKVVKIHQLSGSPNSVCVMVYTLGSGNGWRNLRDCGLRCFMFLSRSCYSRHGVFVNESLVWIIAGGNLVTFNLADERFCEILTSHCPGRLGVMGGVLWCSYSYIHDVGTVKTYIWLVKKNGNQYIVERKEYLSLTRSRKESFDVTPLALMKNGEVLCCDEKKLFSYDMKSSRSKTLVNFPPSVCRTIPHMNTLVSLKDLGEEDTKTME